MKPGRPPLWSYLVALVCSGAALGAIPLLVVALDLQRHVSWILALGCCGLLGLAFACAWPSLSWRWGLWVSSAFWLFFGFVSVTLFVRGRPEWAPLLDALTVAVVGCAGALLGRWSRARTRRALRLGA